MTYLIQLIDLAVRLLILVVIVQAFLSFFVSPYHPVREALDRIVNPLLAPIRRVVPPVGGLDFSPLVLIILIQIAASLIRWVLVSLL